MFQPPPLPALNPQLFVTLAIAIGTVVVSHYQHPASLIVMGGVTVAMWLWHYTATSQSRKIPVSVSAIWVAIAAVVGWLQAGWMGAVSGLLVGVAIAYTWQQHKSGQANLRNKKLLLVYVALVVSPFVLSLLTKAQFHPISQTCQDYQLQKTLYSSTPTNSVCDALIAESEAAYLAAYPVIANRQSSPGYLGLLALGGVAVIAIGARGMVGQIWRRASRPGTLV